MAAPLKEVDDTWVDPQTGASTWSEAFLNMDANMYDPQAQQDAFMAARLDEYLNSTPSDIDSDDVPDERSEPDDSDAEPSQPGTFLCSLHPLPAHRTKCLIGPTRFTTGRGRHAVDLSNLNNEWFPWPDREASFSTAGADNSNKDLQTCVLDILRHVPRCSFSRTQNTAIHWAMQALGLQDLPSDRVMDDVDRILQPLCGIQSIRYSGKLGNIYYANDLAAIIAQVSNDFVPMQARD
jgi:hypothetical protein